MNAGVSQRRIVQPGEEPPHPGSEARNAERSFPRAAPGSRARVRWPVAPPVVSGCQREQTVAPRARPPGLPRRAATPRPRPAWITRAPAARATAAVPSSLPACTDKHFVGDGSGAGHALCNPVGLSQRGDDGGDLHGQSFVPSADTCLASTRAVAGAVTRALFNQRCEPAQNAAGCPRRTKAVRGPSSGPSLASAAPPAAECQGSSSARRQTLPRGTSAWQRNRIPRRLQDQKRRLSNGACARRRRWRRAGSPASRRR